MWRSYRKAAKSGAAQFTPKQRTNASSTPNSKANRRSFSSSSLSAATRQVRSLSTRSQHLLLHKAPSGKEVAPGEHILPTLQSERKSEVDLVNSPVSVGVKKEQLISAQPSENGAVSATNPANKFKSFRIEEGGVPISKNLGTVHRDSQIRSPPRLINFVRKHRGSLPPPTPPKVSGASSLLPRIASFIGSGLKHGSLRTGAKSKSDVLLTVDPRRKARSDDVSTKGKTSALKTPTPTQRAAAKSPQPPKSSSKSPQLSIESPQPVLTPTKLPQPSADLPTSPTTTKPAALSDEMAESVALPPADEAHEQPTDTLNHQDSSLQLRNSAAAMFEPGARSDRPAPEMPTPSDGIDYPRAASWSSSTVAEILKDPLGRQVFRCFLYEALAEENLLFIEALEQLRKEKSSKKFKAGLVDILNTYGSYINLSSVAMSKLREASHADSPDVKCLDLAYKEISKLLENDQYPRFRRSKIYLGFLEKLLPKAYAEKWTTSFDALLGNQVGRHYFRQYLFSVHAEENLRFWESVVEFRGLKNKSQAMFNMGKTIQQYFLKEGATNEVFLPFGLRQRIEKSIREKEVDESLFDDAVKHIELVLKNDPYVRFLQSKDYNELLSRLQ